MRRAKLIFAYFDESGTPNPGDPEDFVLAAVLVKSAQWRRISDGIDGIKRRHFADHDPKDVEIHVKDMLNRSGIYRAVTLDEIYSFLYDVFRFISDHDTPLHIIASIIRKRELRTRIDPEWWNYKFVFERLDSYLGGDRSAAGGGPGGQGIAIIDGDEGRAAELHNKLSGMLAEGTENSRLSHIVERPFFTDSRLRNVSQISDCVSYCVRRSHGRHAYNRLHTPHWQRFYAMIEGKFHSKDGDYKGYGLKVFPRWG